MSVEAVSRGMGGYSQVLDLLSVDEDELTLDRLKRASSLLACERRERFDRGPRVARCRRVRQFFSDVELERFFGLVSSQRDARAFLLALAFGLRVSEVPRASFHEGSMTLRVYSEKLDRYESLPVYEGALDVARWADSLDVSPNGLRNRFRVYRDRDPALCFWYDESDDGRRLSQFSSKSLRKTFVQRVYESSRDPIVASMCSRHSLPSRYGQIASYVFFDDERLRFVLEDAMGETIRRLFLITNHH